ncbi:hypothetical protein BH24ACT13_BH24ACT13_10150 [soil metagenome]
MCLRSRTGLGRVLDDPDIHEASLKAGTAFS